MFKDETGEIVRGTKTASGSASELKPLLLEVLQEAQPQVEALIEAYIEMYKTLHDRDDLGKRMAALENMIATTEKKKQKLLMFNAMGELSDKDFLAMNMACTQELEAAQKELEELTAQRDNAADFKKQIDTIRNCLLNAHFNRLEQEMK